FEEVAFGAEKKVSIPRYEPCETCSGIGAKPGTKIKKCSNCGGSGKVVQQAGFFSMTQACSVCQGKGSFPQSPCTDCRGEGLAKVTRKISVKIPQGVDNGTRLRVRDEGEAGSQGAPRGDLYVDILVKAHEIFERHTNDVYCEVPISFTTAVLGGEVEVPTLENTAKMKIPAGTQSGRVFRLKGKGIASLHDYGRGDELVRVKVEVPTKISPDQENLLREFARLSGEYPGPLSKTFMNKMKRLFK
ncbi:MAG: DnaJ C-terminal domain-containing protein, partial [Candidatus Omnitrophota bacterium]